MDKFAEFSDFLAYLFEEDRSASKAQAITAGILKAHSCRISEVAREMPGA